MTASETGDNTKHVPKRGIGVASSGEM